MKNFLGKSLLAGLCLFTLQTSAWARATESRFNGSFFGASPTGPLSKVEATIEDGTHLYGSAFIRGVDDYDFLYFDGEYVDRAGNIRGTFRSENYSGDHSFFGSGGGTFSGRAAGDAVVLTFKTKRGTATVVLLKAGGNAPTFIAGRVVYFSDSIHEVYVTLYFDEKKVFVDQDGEAEIYVPYTYRQTGPNTAMVSIAGIGTVQLTFTDAWDGRIVGSDFSTSFGSYDYSD